MYTFDVKKVKNDLVEWIRDYFDTFSSDKKAVIGISSGKDSTIVAALCVEALGVDRVVGVLMPDGNQGDIDAAYKVVNHLGIKHYTININGAVSKTLHELFIHFDVTPQAAINLPARIRMATLYAVAQCVNGVPSCNCNLSEDWVGYSTYGGDSFGSFAPLSDLTVTEVKQIGYELGLPREFIEKAPSDGLTGKTDEDNFGFTYEVLDRYIRTGAIDDERVKQKIDDMHRKNMFKIEPMPKFVYEV